MSITDGDTVTFEYTGRLDDGTVFDTSREDVAAEAGLAEAQPERDYDPLTVEVGAGKVIDGMEDGLRGLEADESDTLEIPPEEAYGEWSEEAVQEFDADELREMLGGQTPEEGAYLQAQNGQQGEVVHVDEETVRVDFNPELAGETLTFDVEVVDVE
ncbi:FKBP-type peptidyl-prolyl cis-trans isomerase SlyD [Halarchaeum acidiphilum MH1-52-1]|uniref:Peptidyl-prolyl cis-trans isomerase n=1 Tax=Halarchaeum acidiphilum MH1-52-1 TaxID=1261545 RepID=U3A7E0_9EURY|nr:FKBP-type peptidyl-prolyl cis-trans isomerase [Halarchaeum acidiphilum]GAD53604.1 FKBP-type peptidyl-prolyl cis-trans isomerase SlyD [Halarchaeum acidiphilum MH1-52-1]